MFYEKVPSGVERNVGTEILVFTGFIYLSSRVAQDKCSQTGPARTLSFVRGVQVKGKKR